MSLILNIDTSSNNCSVALSEGNTILSHIETDSRNNTQVLSPIIKQLLKKPGAGTKDLSGIAINIGPGSYTGLRVGLAEAKGLCYSCDIPLIAINGLEALAYSAIKQNKNSQGSYLIVQNNYRDGWYYAVYDEAFKNLVQIDSSTTIESIVEQMPNGTIFLSGFSDNKNFAGNPDILMLPSIHLTASHLAPIATLRLSNANISDITSIQPLYINSLFSSV